MTFFPQFFPLPSPRWVASVLWVAYRLHNWRGDGGCVVGGDEDGAVGALVGVARAQLRPGGAVDEVGRLAGAVHTHAVPDLHRFRIREFCSYI